MRGIGHARGGVNETRLDEQQCADVFNYYRSSPKIGAARNIFTAMVLPAPPTVTLGNMRSMTPAHAEVMSDRYAPWLLAAYDWEKTTGVFPCYIEYGGDSLHPYPVSPNFDAGHITTYQNKQHQQRFRWYWSSEQNFGEKQKHDARVVFFVLKNPPTLGGRLTSAMSRLIPSFVHEQRIGDAIIASTLQQLHPRHVLEHTPPRNTGEENDVMEMEYGEAITGAIVLEDEHYRNMRVNRRRTAVMTSLAQVDSSMAVQSMPPRMRFGNGSEVNSSSTHMPTGAQTNMLDSTYILNPDFHYKSVPTPKVTADLPAIQRRNDNLIALAMDVPPDMLVGAAGATASRRGANGSIITRILKDTTNKWTRHFKMLTHAAFMEIHQEQLNSELHAEKRRRARRYVTFGGDASAANPRLADLIRVHMPCRPFTDPGLYQQLAEDGYMTKKRAGELMFDGYGIDAHDLTVTVTQPAAPQAKRPRRAREDEKGKSDEDDDEDDEKRNRKKEKKKPAPDERRRGSRHRQ